MPWRLDEFRAKICITTSASMPYRVYQACLATKTVSNTRYVQEAVCERLSRDLGIPLADLLAELPAPRGPAAHLYDPTGGHPMDRYRRRTQDLRAVGGGRVRIGPANTDEDVR